MSAELTGLRATGTFQLTGKHADRQAITAKWVFKYTRVIKIGMW